MPRGDKDSGKERIQPKEQGKENLRRNFCQKHVFQDICADVENVCYDDAAESEEATYL